MIGNQLDNKRLNKNESSDCFYITDSKTDSD